MIHATIVKNDYHRPLTTRDLMLSGTKSSDIIYTLPSGEWMVIPVEYLKKDGTMKKVAIKAIERMKKAA